jgi:hypothetical protein
MTSFCASAIDGTTPTGYVHAAYARSLADFGQPRLLPRCGGWLLERSIGNSSLKDLMGCYPFFSCVDWSGLKADLDELAKDYVSVSLVTDPFGRYVPDALRSHSSDTLVRFKQHFVADLRRAPAEFVSKHHRYYARKASDELKVERCATPVDFAEEWMSLYSHLVRRHQLSGIKAFSRRAFDLQLTVPGIVMLRATHAGKTVGAHLWYRHGDVVHSHLAAFNDQGYDLMAAYALYWFALETFAGEARWLNFGAGSGISGGKSDGLVRFKKGWASETRTNHFYGRILDPVNYARLMAERVLAEDEYFPAYRKGEFA